MTPLPYVYFCSLPATPIFLFFVSITGIILESFSYPLQSTAQPSHNNKGQLLHVRPIERIASESVQFIVCLSNRHRHHVQCLDIDDNYTPRHVTGVIVLTLCVCVSISCSMPNGQKNRLELWHLGQVKGYLGFVDQGQRSKLKVIGPKNLSH